MTNVASGFLAGAVMMTRLAPAAMCLAALSRSVKRPVPSNTTSTPRSFHGRSAGSFWASTLNALPSTEIVSSEAGTSARRFPRIESYLRRWARVFVSVRSLTATMSMSSYASAARMMLRPIRPNPLIPTLMAIRASPRLSSDRENSPEQSQQRRNCIKAGVEGGSTLIRPAPAAAVIICTRARAVHAGYPGCRRGAFAVVSLPGPAVPQVRRERGRAHGPAAGQHQRRRRPLHLDSRGLGRRDARRADAHRRPPAALSGAPHLPVDHHADRTPARPDPGPRRRRRLLLSVRHPRLHQPHP